VRAVSTRTLVVVGFVIALTLAGVISFYASGSPDGLDRVAVDLGFSDAERALGTNGGPLAGYELAGVDDSRWSGGLAGVLGCLAVLGCSSVLLLLGRRTPDPARTRGE
jgi:cobalt/nickel transport protein